jgi:hypothetical protein
MIKSRVNFKRNQKQEVIENLSKLRLVNWKVQKIDNLHLQKLEKSKKSQIINVKN